MGRNAGRTRVNGGTGSEPAYAVGLDLGGSALKGVAVFPDGTILRKSHFTTLEAGVASSPCQWPPWAEKARELVTEFEVREGRCASWIGVAAPGLAARDGRSIAYMPGRLEGLEGLDWTQLLERESPVPVLNDAHAALLGETWLGAARGAQNAFMLTLGTGVGGAALVDGRLLHGAIGRAGHLGHICLDPSGLPDVTGLPGSLEDAIGACTLPARSRGRFESTRELIAAVEAGDFDARQIWRRSIHTLACGIASLINVLDPEIVILGGGASAAGPLLFEPLEEHLRTIEWQPGGHRAQLAAAALGEFAGALGAARAAIAPAAAGEPD